MPLDKQASQTDSRHAPAPVRRRVAALLTHPIQYLAPLMRQLAEHPAVDLTVFYMADTGLRAREIEGYGRTIVWDVPLLDGYRHEFLPNHSPRPDGRQPLSMLNPGIATALATGRFDALVMHGYATLTDMIALGTAKALRLPVLFWGDMLTDSVRIHTQSQRLRDTLRRGFCASIDAALAVSTQARRYYERYGVPADRIFWTPLCVDTRAWAASAASLAPRRAALRRELGLDPDLPVVAYVAHMRANKRPKDVVQALERMTVKASLVMAGHGPMFDEVAAYCRDRRVPRVALLGSRNQSELPAVYAAADVFVVPSSAGETMALVIQEAMSSALPVVVSDAVPSTIDFVREGENGFTYPMGDVDALADRLDRVLRDPAQQARMGACSLEMIGAWHNGVTVRGFVEALDVVAPRAR